MAKALKKPIKAVFGSALSKSSTFGSQDYFRKKATVSSRQEMSAILSRYSQLTRSLHAATPDVLINALAPAYDKSQEYVPKKTGALMESGALEVELGADGQAIASILYGTADVWYAAQVHEYVWLAHKSPTRSKYLQAALEEELDSFIISASVDYSMLLGGG